MSDDVAQRKQRLRELMRKQQQMKAVAQSTAPATAAVEGELLQKALLVRTANKLSCAICRVSIDSVSLWNAHVQGRAHAQQLAALRALKAQKAATPTGVAAMPDTTRQQQKEIEKAKEEEEEEKAAGHDSVVVLGRGAGAGREQPASIAPPEDAPSNLPAGFFQAPPPSVPLKDRKRAARQLVLQRNEESEASSTSSSSSSVSRATQQAPSKQKLQLRQPERASVSNAATSATAASGRASSGSATERNEQFVSPAVIADSAQAPAATAEPMQNVTNTVQPETTTPAVDFSAEFEQFDALIQHTERAERRERIAIKRKLDAFYENVGEWEEKEARSKVDDVKQAVLETRARLQQRKRAREGPDQSSDQSHGTQREIEERGAREVAEEKERKAGGVAQEGGDEVPAHADGDGEESGSDSDLELDFESVQPDWRAGGVQAPGGAGAGLSVRARLAEALRGADKSAKEKQLDQR